MNYYETFGRPEIGEFIYFIGYGIVEALKVVKITTEETKEAFIGYVDACRSDGTTESISFNAFGKLAFYEKANAEFALKLEVKND